VVKVKEKYFKTEYRPASKLLDVPPTLRSISRQNTDPQANYLMFHQHYNLFQIK